MPEPKIEINPEQWNQLKELFDQASDLSPGQRQVFVADVSSRDHSLGHALDRLLTGADRESWLSPPYQRPAPAAERERVFEPCQRLLDRYVIHDFLGAGGMGEVYRAFDELTGEWIAIKTLLPEVASRREFVKRFKSEFELAQRIPHENICRLFDLKETRLQNGSVIPFITMELISGVTLGSRLKSTGPMQGRDCWELVSQLLKGLEYAHAAGIIHRDLKDSNIMLTQAAAGQCDRLVIMDFGLAREETSGILTTSLLSSAGMIGTPAYMSPEQLEGKKVTAQSDIYAVGVILFKIVTGQLPFDGDSALAIVMRRMRHAAPEARSLNKDLDPRWNRAIGSCLEADPKWRPASAQHLRVILEGEATPPSKPIWTRRRLAGAGVALAAGIGGVFVWARQPSPRNPEAERHFKLAEEFVKRRNAQDLQNAVQEYASALKIDPSFDEAWAGTAEAWSALANFSLGDSAECQRKALEAAQKAIALRRTARSMGILGYCLLIDVDRWKDAEPYLRKAVEIEPHRANLRLWYGAYLGRLGRSHDAIEQLLAGLEEEPMSFALNQQLSREYTNAGDYQRSLDAARELVRLQPKEGISYLAVARSLEWLKRYDEAERACDQAAVYTKDPSVDALRASIMASRGNAIEARRMARDLESLWRRGRFEAALVAKIYAKLGDREKTLEVITGGVDRKEASVLAGLISPELQFLRDDPRYLRLLGRVGVDAAMLKSGKPPG
jgi:serine/threonine protein kinase